MIKIDMVMNIMVEQKNNHLEHSDHLLVYIIFFPLLFF